MSNQLDSRIRKYDNQDKNLEYCDFLWKLFNSNDKNPNSKSISKEKKPEKSKSIKSSNKEISSLCLEIKGLDYLSSSINSKNKVVRSYSNDHLKC